MFGSPYAIVAVVLAFSLATGGAYVKGRVDGRDLEKAAQAERASLVQEARDAMLKTAAESIAQIEVKHVTIRQQAVREVIDRPVYRECRNTDELMRLLNSARGFPDWQPAMSGELPAPPAD